MSQPLHHTGKRLWLVDFIRGINFVSMVLYHAMYDIVYIFDRAGNYAWYKSTPGVVWQQIIAWTFIFLSGFSFNLGKKHLKHGITVFFAGAVITLSTMLFMPSQTINYGVLTFMGLASLVMIPLSKLVEKVNPWIGAAVCFALFGITRYVPQEIIGFFGAFPRELPDSLYSVPGFAIVGLPTKSFRSADYFPLVPWFFLYAVGYFIAKPILKNAKIKEFLAKKTAHFKTAFSAFSFVGRHTLILYMLHQPIVYAILYATFRLFA